MNNQKVGVIILTYNSEDFIKECILSILKNFGANFEIVVIDNCSTDGTIKVIKKSFPDLKLLKTNKNLGYAGGNNVGINYFLKKKVDYILLLNPDTIVDNQLIEQLVKVMQENNQIGTVGPIITYLKEPRKIWFAGGYFNQMFCYTKHPWMNRLLEDVEIASGPVDFITGACMLIRSKIIVKTGLLPEQYFLYFEDAFFCQQVRACGYKNHLLAKPLVKHIVSASTGEAGKNTLSPLKAYYYGRNPLLYINQQVKGIQKITNYLGQFTISFPYYFLQMAKHGSMESIKSYIKGIYHGLRENVELRR
jgi:GT2 family glycosyltransferase